MFDPTVPYNNIPKLPPKAILETHTVLKHCIAARTALEGLKQMAKRLPNEAVLTNTIPILEAQSSSEIENIVTTADQLFQFADSDGRSNENMSTKEALRYRTALYEGFKSLELRPLSMNTATLICSRIKGVDMDIRTNPGTVLRAHNTGDTIYTPPVGIDLLNDLLKNWEDFIYQDDNIDPLIKMAISHYQFEAIHPFSDGNGRTGRILNILYLIQEELLTIPVLYLSRYIIKNKNDYYHLLNQVTVEQSWEEWIIYMLKAVQETALWTSHKIEAILNLMRVTGDHMKQHISFSSKDLLELLFQYPYCRITNLVDAGFAKPQTASLYLKKLVEKDILKEMKVGREKLFINPRFVNLLIQDKNDFPLFSQT